MNPLQIFGGKEKQRPGQARGLLEHQPHKTKYEGIAEKHVT